MSPVSRSERALALAEQHVEAANYMTAEGRYAEAHNQWHKAATLYEEAAYREGQCFAWMKAGLCSQKVGDNTSAADELAQAVTLARTPGSERTLAIALSHRATLFATGGDLAAAAEGWNEALSLASELHDNELIGAVANNLARLMLERGDLDRAERAFHQARAASERADDLVGLASADNALGEIQKQRGDHEAARELFERAFDSAHQAGDTAAMGLALNNLGNTLRQLGDLERAEQRFQSALAFANVLGDGLAIARTHTNLGNIAAARGQLDDAQRHYLQALQLDKRNQQHQATLGNLVNLANLRSTRGDFAGAKKFYEEALARLPAGAAAARTRADLGTMLGQLEGRLGHLDQAEALFKDALHHAELSGYQAASARLSMNLAAIAHARGDLIAALDGYRRAVGLLDQHASPSDRVMGHLVVADIALARDMVGLAEAAIIEAQKRLDAMRGDDEGTLREALDVDAMKARVAFARQPDDESRTRMEAAIERFMEAGRVADALSQQLALYDEDPHDGILATRLPRIRESLAWAKKQNIDPLVLELTSLEALATNSAPETVVPLTTRARELGLELVALRLERRRAALLLHHGNHDDAQSLIAELVATAKTLGADAETQRLQRLAPR